MFPESDILRAASEALKRLGYSELRPQQEEVVRKFVQGHDVFVSLPTGSGKSLCYCILPEVFDILRKVKDTSIFLVVSPLIVLMKDQVTAMEKREVTAVYASEKLDEDTAMDVCIGKYQLVYMSPESLLTDERWRDMLQSPIYEANLVALAVDEAHCVTKW